jgi:4-hydroxy-2-oxoheptanedioate aldolase
VRPGQLRSSIAAGEPLFGTWVQTPSAELVEMLGQAGWDFVILDLEHGHFGAEALPHLLRAAEVVGCAALVRVPLDAPEQFGKALDLDAAGIVVPGVAAVDQAVEAVRLTRFPPRGTRGASPSTRQLRYSALPFASLTSGDVAQPLVVLQIEAELAKTELDTVLAVDGVDVVFVGPFDLSASLGLPGQLDHPRVIDAIAGIVRSARDRGIAVGLWVPDAPSASRWLEMGVRFVTVSNNELIFFGAAAALRRDLGEPR